MKCCRKYKCPLNPSFREKQETNVVSGTLKAEWTGETTWRSLCALEKEVCMKRLQLIPENKLRWFKSSFFIDRYMFETRKDQSTKSKISITLSVILFI